MKKLLTTAALAGVAVLSFAQNKLPIDAGTPRGQGPVSSQSISFGMDEKGFNLLYLNDGDNSLVAVSRTLFPIKGFNGRLRVMALGATDPANSSNKTYLTAGLGYNLFNAASGFRLDLFAGPKGINVADGFKIESGAHSLVFGFGVTIPFGS